MIQLNLTVDEIQLLSNLIDTCLQDLRVEIQATDNMGFKDMLKQRKGLLLKLESSLKESQTLPVAG